MPGPMFAVTVAKSYRSPWAGARISIGHAIVEVPLILLIYFGFGRFFENAAVQVVLSAAGGAMVIWLALGMFRARREVVRAGRDLPYGAVTAGILMSALNPFFLLWWATIGSMLVMRASEFAAAGMLSMTLVHWGCDLLWLTLVSVLIYRTQSLWGPRLQEAVFVLCGVLLAGFGVWFVVSGIQQAA